MFLLVSAFMFYVVVMFFYILLQDFKHTLSKSAERFDLAQAILFALVWPVTFAVTIISVVCGKVGIDD